MHETRNPNPATDGGFPTAQSSGPVPILSRQWLDWGFINPMRFIIELDQKAINAALKNWAQTEIILPRGLTLVSVFFCVDDQGNPIAKITATDEPTQERGKK